MLRELSFKSVVNTCEVLGKFADARSGPQPNRDIILTVQKIEGREELKLIKISDLNWLARAIRWFGFGDSSLKRVASYLQNQEPYLPRHLRDLREPVLEFYYPKEDFAPLLALNKERFKQLRDDKTRGYDLFKQCLEHHNAKHWFGKVDCGFDEDEKINLGNSGKTILRNPYPNPIGLLPGEDEVKISRKYKSYLPSPERDPQFYDPNVHGFCLEYGLGAKKDLEQALHLYQAATKKNPHHFAAFFNLGRLHLQKNEKAQAREVLTQAEAILTSIISEGREQADQMAANKAAYDKEVREGKRSRSDFAAQRLKEIETDLRDCQKALDKTRQALQLC